MSNYKFDVHNFNTVMREMFIHRMNELSGFDPETGENPGQPEHFHAAQENVARARILIEGRFRQAHKSKKNEAPPLWTFGLVIHQRYVENKMSWDISLSIPIGKHIKRAKKLYERHKPELTEEEAIQRLKDAGLL